MLYPLLLSAALAGPLNPLAEEAPEDPATGLLSVDAKMPAEILIDGYKLAQLYAPAEVSFEINAGTHMLRIYTNGEPTELPVIIPEGQDVHVLMGRNGLSMDEAGIPHPQEGDLAEVQFRALNHGAAMVILGHDRHRLTDSQRLTLHLGPGDHPMSVRSPDGTVIWATGSLHVDSGAPLIVHISEGRMPEVSGGGSFSSSGG